MSLYIINNLNSRLAVNNYSALVFRRDKFFTTGSYYEGMLNVDSSYAAGESITLTIGSISISLTLVAGIPISPYEIPAFQISNYAYAGIVAQYLRKIALLDELFVIEKVISTDGTFGKVRLRARNAGSEYNISWDVASSLPSELTAINAGVDVVALGDYKMNLEVQCLVNGKWNVIYQATADPLPDFESNSAIISFYDVASVVKPYLNYEPITDVYAAKVQHTLFAKVRVYYWERFGDVDYHKERISSSDLTMLLIGLNIGQSEANARLEAYHYFNSAHNFLTNANRTKYISRAQPEFLTFIKRGTLASYVVTAYFSDNTNTSYTYSFSSLWGLAPNDNEVVLIPSGFKNLRLEMIESSSKKVVRYTIALNTGSGIASEVFTYVMDERYFSDEVFFLFYNSLSGVDSIRFTGYEVSSAETMYDETSIAMDGNSSKALGLFGQSGKSLRKKWKYNSGWNEATEQTFLNEFFASENIWRVEQVPDYSATTQARTMLEKVVVQNKKIELIDREQFVYEAEFDVLSANESVGLSDAVPDVDTADYPDVSKFEFANDSDEPQSIQFQTTGTNQRLYVNGVQYSAGNNSNNFTYSLAAQTTAEFEIKAKNAATHTINAIGESLSAKVLHVNTNIISSLTLRYFDKVHTQWFAGRLRHWLILGLLRIYTVENEVEVDMLLHELAALKVSGGAITDADILGGSPAPSIYGAEAKAYMNANGVTVSTN